MEAGYYCPYDYVSINGQKFCGYDNTGNRYQNTQSDSVNIEVYTDGSYQSDYATVYLACTSSLNKNETYIDGYGSGEYGSGGYDDPMTTVGPTGEGPTEGYSNETDSQCYYGIMS